MNQNRKQYLKPRIKVTGSDVEFVLKLGTKSRFYGNLEDRAINNMERWGITEINDGSQSQRRLTNRFDFSVNEEADLRAVATFFIERLGITDYCLDVTFN